MLGAMGAAGPPVTLLSMTLPTITLALGTAYAIHVLTAAAGADGPDHVEAALRRVSLPVALSGLTTTIGFLSMAAVRIDAVREVGLFGSIGVLGVTAAVLTLLPAILALRPAAPTPPRFSRPLAERLGSALARHAFRHRRRVVAGWLGATALLLVGAARLDVQTDATSWFPPGNPVRDDYEAIRQQLSGISPVNVVVHAGTHGRVTEPAVIAALDGLAVHLEGLDAVGKAVSLADPLRQIHGGFLGDPTQPLPGRRDLSEQYLLLLESVEPIADLVTPDRLTANVVLRVDDNRSGSLLAVAREAERWWARNGPPGTRAQATGTMFEFARAEDEMTYGQLRGLGLAVGALALILLAVFGSPGLVATALVPNLLPVMAMFGCMGLAGVPLDAGTVIVGALALGMAVDDTMHVVTGFHEARLVGADRLDAVRRTLGENLPAVTYTTLVVSLGFGILALSGFTFVRHFGLLIAGVMGVCWLADAHLLPALFARDAKDCAHTASEGRRAA